MLRLGKPQASRLNLGGGAYLMVRPATTFDVDRAGAAIGRLILGLAAGEDAAREAAAIMGDEFATDDASTEWRSAVAERLGLIELGAMCVTEWGGIGDEDGNALPLSKENLARLLQDAVIAKRVSAAINTSVHLVVTEGEKSPVSPNGAVAAGENSAPIVTPSAAPAPAAA